MYGFGDLLRIDLSSETVRRDAIPLSLRRQYIGGEGINSRLLWEHFLAVDPKIDPRGVDNVLIIGLGPLGGTPFGLGSKTKFTFKSPAYGIFGDSVAGGSFGTAMRWAGYDHIVITGKANRPLYLSINDDLIALRDAGHLWGKNASETTRIIAEQAGDDDVHTACIGRAGENLVGFASITVDAHRAAGRTGGGCVMGSKNLKAIAVAGTKGLTVANPAALLTAMDGVLARLQKVKGGVAAWRRAGTLDAVDFYDILGSNFYRNGQLSISPKETSSMLNAAAYASTLIDHAISCSPGCQTACAAWHRTRGFESPAAKRFAGQASHKPEYLAVGALGLGADIPDLPAVIHLNDMCYDYGVDVAEMGAAVSLLMELWEKGLIGPSDLSGWLGQQGSLEWGNWEVAEKIITTVGEQDTALGRLFCDNVYHAAQRIEELKGVPATKYVCYGKGGAVFAEDHRPFPNWATNAAVSVRGADHLKGFSPMEKGGRKDISTALFGRPDAGLLHGVTLKGAASAYAENLNCAINSTGICVFMPMKHNILLGTEALAPGLNAVSGLSFDPPELYKIGERICNIEKAFNSRLGLRREDDTLCDRWMNEPAPQGPGKGMKAADYLEQTLDEYYDYHGWDKATSLQKREKLNELDLSDVADVLAQEGGLVD